MESFSLRIYRKLISVESTEGVTSSGNEAQVAGNFVIQLVCRFLSSVGDALSNPKIILPWLIETLHAPVFLIGLLVPIRESGSLLPQVFIASWIRKKPIRKWIWIGGNAGQALFMLGIAWVAWSLKGAVAGWSIIGLLIGFSIARGFSSVAAKDVTGKTIPSRQRGQLTGWSASAAGLVTIGVALILLLAPDQNDNLMTYTLLIVAAATCWLLSSLLFIRIQEQPGETEAPTENLMTDTLMRLQLITRDVTLRHFVLARSLLLCSALTAPYYVALAQEQTGSQPWLLGLFILASGSAALVSGPIWGRFADQASHRVMRAGGLITAVLGLFIFLVYTLKPEWLHAAGVLPVAYFALAVAHQGVRVGRKTYVVDVAEGNLRTDYVTISNTVIGLVLLLTGLSGWLASAWGYATVILVLSLLGLVGAWLSGQLKNPLVPDDR